MISFFSYSKQLSYVVEHTKPLDKTTIDKLLWLFNCSADTQPTEHLEGNFAGPRAEMISPWSTNAVEIAQDMVIEGITRIEKLRAVESESDYDPMLEALYKNPSTHIFDSLQQIQPESIRLIEDINAYNVSEGLALSAQEVEFLESLSQKLQRPLTDSEIFGFSQVNSEHCRHKIFGGTFVIDGEEKESSLFEMIKETSKQNPNQLVSAYKDNVAFIKGPKMQQFAPIDPQNPSLYQEKEVSSVLSLKAETHNFPTTVEPFNGAATGTGGEIRDRMAGGKGSIPLAGTAVYMTSYPGEGKALPPHVPERRSWLYRTPREILTKASNGASDFGNKFGQPIITGSLLTFEHKENEASHTYGYDKVIMLAGGIGYARSEYALKGSVAPNEDVVVMGGDNYRIGMGGGAVSSVNTGQYSSGIELNAVQRANPEMQKRVQNVIRALAESDDNPLISIHDHGAGGHMNCLTELIEETGGTINIDALPIGDKTLSDREILGNESQERMGLVMKDSDFDRVEQIALRERAPIYKVGVTDNSKTLTFARENGTKAVQLPVEDMLAKPPKTVMHDNSVLHTYENPDYDANNPLQYIEGVLSLEGVACKDWLTNKVDRSVTGRIARQQTCGTLQLPLADLGAVSLDFEGSAGIATAIGHAPRAALASPQAGSQLSIAEALTNIVFAPLADGIKSVSLSANWMWPCKNEGEDARLYSAVEAASEFAIDLGINIPTGKDSLSMTQKYPDGQKVLSPGTVIISAGAEVSNIRQIVDPALKPVENSYLLYIDFSFAQHTLGGSALFQSMGAVGSTPPVVADSDYFVDAFNAVQELIKKDLVLAGHDISDGGMITTLLEMAFPVKGASLKVDLSDIAETDLTKILYAENPAVILQVSQCKEVDKILEDYGVAAAYIGAVLFDDKETLTLKKEKLSFDASITHLRNVWFAPSLHMERFQTPADLAQERASNIDKYPLHLTFPKTPYASNVRKDAALSGVKAAVLRDKGSNGERELAYALYRAGFDVKDVHVTDLISGRETLDDVQMIAFCGGFSRSDVLGSAKGWAAAIKYSPVAAATLKRFYEREDTLSLGICNGCQLMAIMGFIYPDFKPRHTMEHNSSAKLESIFTSVTIPANNSVMLHSLEGLNLGVWCVHGEGRFSLSCDNYDYNIAAQYTHDAYPANPNGSTKAIAALASADGRHLAMMPHPERSIMPWQCGYYPIENKEDAYTPWMEAFRNAYNWCVAKK